MATLLGLFFSKIYKSLLRYAGADTFFQAAIATLAGTGITYLISMVVSLFCGKYEDQIGARLLLMPRPIYLIQWVITMALITGSRFLIRYRTAGAIRKSGEKQKRFLIISAGYAGATVIRDIQNGRYGNATAVVALDEDPVKTNAAISRVPVVKMDVEEAAEQYRADEIIITVYSPKQELIEACMATGKKVWLFSEAQGVVRELNIADLLNRSEEHLDMSEADPSGRSFAARSWLLHRRSW